jgi:drug/metabolite transporter (DMT)-like permease
VDREGSCIVNLINTTLIVGTVAALSVGQVLFKVASATLKVNHPETFLSPALLTALVIYGVATIAWLIVLSRVPLSSAFPFYGLTFFFVPVLASFFLGERINISTVVGSVVIAAGVLICSRGAAS